MATLSLSCNVTCLQIEYDIQFISHGVSLIRASRDFMTYTVARQHTFTKCPYQLQHQGAISGQGQTACGTNDQLTHVVTVHQRPQRPAKARGPAECV
jgi:hypothetical protein